VKTHLLAALLVLFLFPAAAFAQDDEDMDDTGEESQEAQGFDRSGWQYNGGIVGSFEDFDKIPQRDDAVGIEIGAMFRLIPNWSTGFGYHWSGAFERKGASDLSVHLVTWDSKVHMLTGRIQPYFKLGIGWIYSDLAKNSASSSFGARFSLGIDGYITDKIGMYVDGGYIVSARGLEGLEYAVFGAGAIYRF